MIPLATPQPLYRTQTTQIALTTLNMDLCHCCLKKFDAPAVNLTKIDYTQTLSFSHYFQVKVLGLASDLDFKLLSYALKTKRKLRE